jgi:hypothetical protein
MLTPLSSFAVRIPQSGVKIPLKQLPLSFGASVPREAYDPLARQVPTVKEMELVGQASCKADIAALKGFAGRGFDFNTQDERGFPLFLKVLSRFASQDPQGLLEAMTVLVNAEADFTCINMNEVSDSGKSLNAAFIVASHPNRNSVAQLDFLKKLGADFKVRNFHGNTPFHEAVYLTQFPTLHDRKISRSVVDWFFKNNQTVSSPNKKGETPAFIAATGDPVVLRKFFPQLNRFQASQIVGVLGDYNVKYPLSEKEDLEKALLLQGLVDLASASKGNQWRVRGRDWWEELKASWRNGPSPKLTASYQMSRELLSYVNAFAGTTIEKLRGDAFQ